jgi:hypothetical protein
LVKPSGAEYEALAHEIVTELATVTHDDHIVARESEARRQIDISARWTDGGDGNLLIVQVKDYKRKAGDLDPTWIAAASTTTGRWCSTARASHPASPTPNINAPPNWPPPGKTA